MSAGYSIRKSFICVFAHVSMSSAVQNETHQTGLHMYILAVRTVCTCNEKRLRGRFGINTLSRTPTAKYVRCESKLYFRYDIRKYVNLRTLSTDTSRPFDHQRYL